MKKEESLFEGIVAFILSVTVSAFTIAYKVFAIMKFIKWFNVPITMTFQQWYGLISIIGLISYSWVKTDDEGKSIWFKMFYPILVSIFMTSMSLVIYYAISQFI